MKTKICTKCEEEKPFSEFHKNKNKKDGYNCQCKNCVKEYHKKYAQKPEVKKRKNEWHREYNKTPQRQKYIHDAGIKRYKKKRRYTLLKWKYGKDAVKIYNKLFDLQKGQCAICGKHESELGKNLSVDHCHVTKKIRGLLCQKCNDGLGRFNADEGPKLLQKAVKYIEEFYGG